jgi:hypothetical protein
MQPPRVFVRRISMYLFLAGVLSVAVAPQGRAGSAIAPPEGVWTVVIPESHPDYVYMWRLKTDDTYEEDGRDADTGTAIQPTLSGTWAADGARLTLRQNDIAFVFEGLIVGERYTGTLSLGGRDVSHFCAAKGTVAPERCDAKDVTASAASSNRFGDWRSP